MSGINFKFDARSVKAYMERLGDKTWSTEDPRVSRFFQEFLARMLWEANNKAPRTPHDTGFLRGSGRFVAKGSGKKVVKAVAGFNAIYAARMHEGKEEWNWSEPGTGPKFLEKKCPEIAVLWGQAWVNAVKSILRGLK